MKLYKINDKEFYQDKLKLGQIKQLLPYLDKIVGAFDKEDMNLIDLVTKLSDDISQILAVILIEKGTNLRDKNIEDLSAFLDENLDLDGTLEIVADFFDITPIGSLIEKIGRIFKVQTSGKISNTNTAKIG